MSDECRIFNQVFHADARRTVLRMAVDAIDAPPQSSGLRPLTDWLVSYRFYQRYQLWPLRDNGSKQDDDDYLHVSGRNVFSVLRNWSTGSKDLRRRYDFVLSGLRAAFPGTFDDLELKLVGQTVVARLSMPGLDETLPHHLAPNGWLLLLLHLCAIASARRGGRSPSTSPRMGCIHLRSVASWNQPGTGRRRMRPALHHAARGGSAALPPEPAPQSGVARQLLARPTLHSRRLWRPAHLT